MIELNNFELYVGADLSNQNVTSERKILIGPSSDFFDSTTIEINGNLYDVAYSDDYIIRAIFFNTSHLLSSSKKQSTPEGIYIGMTYENFCQIIPDANLRKIIGWGYVYILPSGWKILFATGRTLTEHFPLAEDRIIKIYKDT
jgi:hypothetical protein